jgi:predicted lipoprotein with Yx(FWY)xxD motif
VLLLALVGSVGGATLMSSAATASTVAGKDKTVTVVKEEVRGSFGEILTNDKSHALYIDESPPCLDGCIISWPPLLMPKGTTTPAGAPDLGTTPYGSDRLQVTYKGWPLYTYWRDTKRKILGNGCGGFYVATVSS